MPVFGGAECQHAAAVHGQRGVHGRGAAVERGAEVAAGDGDVGAGGEAKRRPGQAELQDGGVGVVVDQQVGRVQRAVSMTPDGLKPLPR